MRPENQILLWAIVIQKVLTNRDLNTEQRTRKMLFAVDGINRAIKQIKQ